MGAVAALLVVLLLAVLVSVTNSGASTASARPGTTALPGHLLDYVQQSDLAHTAFGAQNEPALEAAANAICEDHWIAPSDFTNLGDAIAPIYMVLAGTGWLDEYDWPAMTSAQAQEFINAAITTECPDQTARIH